MIKSLLSLPYELARLPLVAVDKTLGDRLPETSGPRVTLERAIGSADRVAGALLANPEIARRGADRVERVEKLVTAARLEQDAEARREQARETTASGRREAAQKREAAKNRAASALDTADRVEARRKQEASEKAAKAAASKKTAAARKAKARKASVEGGKDKVVSAAQAKKQAAQREAKAELDDARATKAAAAEARADAERLSDLTEAKKAERQQS